MKGKETFFAILMLTIGFASVGLFLDAKYHFLSYEGTFLSSRAMLAGRGDPPSLANIGLVYPPLAFYLAVPFTWLYLPHPSIWLSATFGASLTVWFVGRFRSVLLVRPQLMWLALLVPIQPGVWNSSVTGTTTIVFLAMLCVALFLTGRFALDQEVLEETRAKGQMSAWLNSNEYLNERVRFLWSAALALGVCGFARSDLIYCLLLLVPMTPFLLAGDERGDIWKVVTLGLLLYMPLLVSQFIWGYLSWVFTDDFFYAVSNPSSILRNMDAKALLRPEVTILKHNLEAVVKYFGEVLVIGSPLLIYLLLRLRSISVTVVFMLPFFVEGIAAYQGKTVLSRELYSIAGLECLLCIIFGVLYGRLRKFEVSVVSVAMVLSTAWSWVYFSDSSYRDDQIWRQIAMGQPKLVERFMDERRIADIIRQQQEYPGAVLMDSNPAFAIVALVNQPGVFTLPYQKKFFPALQNPSLLSDAVVARLASSDDGKVDVVGERWNLLENDVKSAFVMQIHQGDWTLFRKKVSSPIKTADSKVLPAFSLTGS